MAWHQLGHRYSSDAVEERVRLSTTGFPLDAVVLTRIFELSDSKTRRNARLVSVYFCAVVTQTMTYSIYAMKKRRETTLNLSALTRPYVTRFVFDVGFSKLCDDTTQIPCYDCELSRKDAVVRDLSSRITAILLELGIARTHVVFAWDGRDPLTSLSERMLSPYAESILVSFPGLQRVIFHWQYALDPAIPSTLYNLRELRLEGGYNLVVPTLPSLSELDISVGRTCDIATQPALMRCRIRLNPCWGSFSVKLGPMPKLRALSCDCFASCEGIDSTTMPLLSVLNARCACKHCCRTISLCKTVTAVTMITERENPDQIDHHRLSSGYLDHVRKLRVIGRNSRYTLFPRSIPSSSSLWSRLQIKVLEMENLDSGTITALAELRSLHELRIRFETPSMAELEAIHGLTSLGVLAVSGKVSIGDVVRTLPPVHTLVLADIDDSTTCMYATLCASFETAWKLKRLVLGEVGAHNVDKVWHAAFSSPTIDTIVFIRTYYDIDVTPPSRSAFTHKRVIDGSYRGLPAHTVAALTLYERHILSSDKMFAYRSVFDTHNWHTLEDYDLMLIV